MILVNQSPNRGKMREKHTEDRVLMSFCDTEKARFVLCMEDYKSVVINMFKKRCLL